MGNKSVRALLNFLRSINSALLNVSKDKANLRRIFKDLVHICDSAQKEYAEWFCISNQMLSNTAGRIVQETNSTFTFSTLSASLVSMTTSHDDPQARYSCQVDF